MANMPNASNEAARPWWWRWLAGAAVLVFLAGAYWPVPIDDTFISAAYAFELLERGELAWPGAGRLEGFSDLLWVLVMALAAKLGADPILVAKVLSLLSGLGLVGMVSKAVPTTRRGDLVVAVVVLWMPLAYWSAMALETASYAALVVGGWLLVLEGRQWGLALLLVASLLRFEGALWWLAGSGALWVVRRRRGGVGIAATAILLGAYHAWRVAYFGAWVPASVYLKANLGWFAAVQLVEEALVAAGLLGVAALFVMPRAAWRSWIPPALGVVLLVAMNGDWMARGRMLLPALIAMVVVRARYGEPRPVTSRTLTLVVALAVVASLFEPRFLERPRLRAFLPRFHETLAAPLLEPITYVVEHVPDGGVLASADIGLLGHVPAMTVVDTRGLVSPMFHRFRRSRDLAEVGGWWRSGEGPDVVAVSRYMPVDFLEGRLEPHPGLDPWLVELSDVLDRYPVHRDLLYDEDSWRGAIRFHHRVEPDVSAEVVARRWRGLAERFPAHAVFGERAASVVTSEATPPAASARAR